MNSMGTLLRFSIFGESHGRIIGGMVDGCPAGIPLTVDDFSTDLARRSPGVFGTTARRESDSIELLTGVYGGYTTGAPIVFASHNADIQSSDYEKFLKHPRPGHADFVARKKHAGFSDIRGSGHFSGRLTLAMVAGGVIAKKLLPYAHFSTQLIEVGGSTDCFESIIACAVAEGDSVGGIIECRVSGVPVGFGEPFFGNMESTIAATLFAIPGVRGVEFGDGFSAARMRGSQHNDPIIKADGTTSRNGAGGINGGISNGNEIVVRIAVKPTSSIEKSQTTWNFATKAMEELSSTGRHDACFAVRVPVVAEAALALCIADFSLLCGERPV